MAEFNTIRTATGTPQPAQIDAGLRAHMNKVYGTMSVGMLLTFAVAWAVGTSPALLSVFRDPATLQPNILGYIVMFAPLIMVFAFGAVLNRMSAAAAQLFFYAFAAVMGLSISWIFHGLYRLFDRTGIPDHRDLVRRSVALGLYHQERHLGLGQFPDHGADRPDRGLDRQHLPWLAGDHVRNLGHPAY